MTLPQSYFDDLYVTSDDPWSFRTRRYEARKRSLTLDALLEEHYSTAFEPGCSIGTLSIELARRCERLVAMDISASALDLARTALPDTVTLLQGALPHDWPEEHVDLLVLSEVGYYLSPVDCAVMAARAVSSSDEILAVHWRHEVADYPMSGDAVHEVLTAAATEAGLAHAVHHLEVDLRLDVWSVDHRSVAQRTFLDQP